MLIVGIVLSVVGIGFFCWLLFTLAVYALPFFAGLTAGLAAFHSGSGVIGALIVGVLAGGATLAIGQIAFATVRTPLIRAVIGLLYRRAGRHRRLPRDAWARAYRRAVRRLARGLRGRRRCSGRRHGLGAHVAVCPAACRAARCGRSGIVSTGGRDQGRVSLRLIVDRLDIGAVTRLVRMTENAAALVGALGSASASRPTETRSVGGVAVGTD